MGRRTSTASPGMKRAVEVLTTHGPMDLHQLAEKACIAYGSLRYEYRKTLVDAELIHLCDWRKNGHGSPTPIYAAGPGKPAKRPKKYTHKELRLRNGGKAQKAAAGRLTNLKRYDPALAALMGRAA
jgi:hypothetical protein